MPDTLPAIAYAIDGDDVAAELDTQTANARAGHFVEDACAARRVHLLWAIEYFRRGLECLKTSGLIDSEIERARDALFDACDGARGQIVTDMDNAGKYADVLGPIDLSGLESVAPASGTLSIEVPA
jgi:hypothetical protein